MSSCAPHQFVHTVQKKVKICVPVRNKPGGCSCFVIADWNIQQRLQRVDIRYAEIHINPEIFGEKSVFNPKILSKLSAALTYFETKTLIPLFLFPTDYSLIVFRPYNMKRRAWKTVNVSQFITNTY